MISTNPHLPLHCSRPAEVFEGSGLANVDAHTKAAERSIFMEGFDAGFTWGIVAGVFIAIVISIL
ncbi:MAG TPA: hypothetical protein VGO57_09560 [Verrucomicrobiae bacterium]|jgi:hypothetical protein